MRNVRGSPAIRYTIEQANVESPALPPNLTAVVAEHALFRLAVHGQRSSLAKLPRDELLKLARAILDYGSDRRQLQAAYQDEASSSAFYRFVRALQTSAVQVHREMVADAVGPTFLTPPTAAKRLGISQDELRRLVEAGDLQAVNVGNDFRVTTEALTEFAAANAVAPGQRRE